MVSWTLHSCLFSSVIGSEPTQELDHRGVFAGCSLLPTILLSWTCGLLSTSTDSLCLLCFWIELVKLCKSFFNVMGEQQLDLQTNLNPASLQRNKSYKKITLIRETYEHCKVHSCSTFLPALVSCTIRIQNRVSPRDYRLWKGLS